MLDGAKKLMNNAMAFCSTAICAEGRFTVSHSTLKTSNEVFALTNVALHHVHRWHRFYTQDRVSGIRWKCKGLGILGREPRSALNVRS